MNDCKENEVPSIKHIRKKLFKPINTLNIFCPDFFVNYLSFNISPGEYILILLDDTNHEEEEEEPYPKNPRHDCDYIPTYTTPLGIVVHNKSIAGTIAIEENEILANLLSDPALTCNFCYIKPCYPKEPTTTKHFNFLNLNFPGFYLNLPRFKWNKYKLDEHEIKGHSKNKFPMKEKFLYKPVNNFYNPKNWLSGRPFTILPQDHFFFTIAKPDDFFVYDCSLDLMTKFSTDFLAVIVHNSSKHVKFQAHQGTYLFEWLSDPNIRHQMCRLKQNHCDPDCVLM